MLLMSRVSTDSHWTVLLPGFIVGGVGIGMTNAPLASTAVSTVPQERAGMASGINNTFRQVGIATGIAGLGAIFQDHVTSKVVSSFRGMPNAHALATQFANGRQQQAIQSLPPQLRAHAALVARASFVAGLHDILLVGAAVAGCGAVLAVLLVRRRDFVASGQAATAG
jgi:hypothetical protein